MRTRTFLLPFLKNFILWVIIFTISITSAPITFAVDAETSDEATGAGSSSPNIIDTGESYKRQQGVRWFDYCSTSGTSPSDSSSKTSSSSSSGDGGGCGEKAGDSEVNKDQIWSYFLGKFQDEGYSLDEAEKATAGIMGNWLQESGFNPDRHNAPNPGSGCSGASGPVTGTVGLGIAQWCGSRQGNLRDYAQERGGDISCLGIQLEFTWKEMQERNLDKDMKGLSPAQSSQMFDEIFEVSNGTGERQKKGEDIYKERTGKAPTALGSSSGSGSSSGGSCGSTGSSKGGIPSEECAALIKEFNDLVASGDIRMVDANRQENDLKNCTTDQIDCGTNGGKGGVNPKVLRALLAAVNNSDGPVTLWSFNTGHDCDGLNHPKGKAVDIVCSAAASSNPRQADNADANQTSNKTCRQMIDFLIENKEELGVTELLWQNDYKCDSGVDCTIGGHADHIHLGTNPAGGDDHDH